MTKERSQIKEDRFAFCQQVEKIVCNITGQIQWITAWPKRAKFLTALSLVNRPLAAVKAKDG